MSDDEVTTIERKSDANISKGKWYEKRVIELWSDRYKSESTSSEEVEE